MTFIYSFILSLAAVIIFSLVFREEAGFWREKIISRFRRKNKPVNETEPLAAKPIDKFCGFRDWSEKGGEICTIFQLEDGNEYKVTESICRQCQVWDQYQTWLDSGKKENFSVTLAHTLKGSKPMVVETDKLNPEMGKGLAFNDYIIRRRHFPWAGKATIAFLTLATYLIVYFSGIFTNPIVRANPDTWYLWGPGSVAGLSYCWNMLTSEPSGYSESTMCRNVLTANTSKYCHLKPNQTNSTWEASYNGPKILGWVTDIEGPYIGTIESGNWTVYGKYIFTEGSGCTYTTNRIEFKIWKADIDIETPVVIKDWTTLCNVSDGTNTCSATFNPGAVDLSNQVLFAEFRQYNVYSCARINAILKFVVEEGGATEKITTPTYAAVPENSFYFVIAVPFIPLIIRKWRLKDYIKKPF